MSHATQASKLDLQTNERPSLQSLSEAYLVALSLPSGGTEATVQTMDPVKPLPDLILTANAGLVDGRYFILQETVSFTEKGEVYAH